MATHTLHVEWPWSTLPQPKTVCILNNNEKQSSNLDWAKKWMERLVTKMIARYTKKHVRGGAGFGNGR